MSPIALEPPDVDTRDFAEWLRDYVNDAEAAVVAVTSHDDGAVRQYRGGIMDAAREILERYQAEQEQNDDRDA